MSRWIDTHVFVPVAGETKVVKDDTCAHPFLALDLSGHVFFEASRDLVGSLQ